MNKRIIRFALSVLLFGLLLALDQWTKGLAAAKLQGQEPFVILNGIFELQYSENMGAAFGLLEGHHILFMAVAALVFAAVLYLLWTLPADKRYLPLIFCMTVIAAGAAGNLIDRMTQGYVVDFFYFKLIDFPIFNVADCYVTGATGLLFVLLFFGFYSDEELTAMLPGRKESA